MKYKQTFKEALRQVREDGHTDVASAVRQCKTTMEDASQMLSKLQGMNPEGDLPSWWMNKIAIAANSMNKLRDYLLVPSTNEAKEEPQIEPEEKPKEDKKEISDGKDAVKKLEQEIQMLKIELENEKNKTVRPEPNPVTGEVPLRTGIAGALLDKSAKNKVKDVLNRVKKKKEMKVGGKTKVKVDPDFDVGQYSDGTKVPTSNLG